MNKVYFINPYWARAIEKTKALTGNDWSSSSKSRKAMKSLNW